MLLKDKKIAIIGGGPGGLTLARLLQLKGADVTVYERDVNRDVRVQGGALDLHTESGLAALQQAGLMDAFKSNFRPGADKIRVTDNQATVHYDQHEESSAASFGHKHHRPEIDRGPLRNILLDSLRPGTVCWNSHIVALEETGNTWKIVFQNGHVATAGLVIGADGANSKVRRFVTGVKPVWAGITMIEGVIHQSAQTAPRIHQLLNGGKIFAFGNEKTLIVSSRGDGNFGFATGCRTSENWVANSGIDFNDHAQVLNWFKKEFPEWGEVWHELFASAESLFIPRPQYCMPLNLRWEAKKNVTLIGDAAHWMPPFAGEGVNMAMLDALQLSECLADQRHTDLQTAIAAYEKRLFKRFARIGRLTLFNTDWMHRPAAITHMLNMFSGNIFKQLAFVAKSWLYEVPARFTPRSVAGTGSSPG
ncbi:FAD-dependent oxidoreductase [Hufsiella ginkgonis]|uniref:Flavin-dependent monooxygenase n=1 Tax=Hufsiella ginkgonis TaxID=2695274 RepID=A0A7K1XSX2_9SPHI|nr:NAD(P)/FAD-dependent oxidoreductase [Hufsiella ginkgonis]MXV13859.1 NAD(P)-binding protein [Hufsiella ginkgonis]